MNKGSIIRLIVAFCVLALGTGIVVGGKIGMNTVGASGISEDAIYSFNDMHMHNIYKSAEHEQNGHKMTEMTFELFVSKEYSGSEIFAMLKTFDSSDEEKIFFTKTREDIMTTSDGCNIEGYIYVARVTKEKGYKGTTIFYNDNTKDKIVDCNNAEGYELLF